LQYAFGINLYTYAIVTNLVSPEVHPPFQVAIPLYVTFAQTNPAFRYSLVTDSETLKAFKYNGLGAAANYFYPPVFFNGLPSQLGIRYL
jgi:hypothetical protein